MKLNERDYPGLPDTFLHDLKVELGIDALRAPAPLPGHSEREFPETIEITKSILGIGFRTVPGEPVRVITTWAYPRPDGSVCTMDVTVPDEARAQLGTAELTGDAMITAVYAAALPAVRAAFLADWGV